MLVVLISFQALRVSMEEQRQRQEEEARRATAASGEETPTPQAPIADSEEAMLQQALSMSTPQTPVFDFGAMTEEQQIEYAMRLSLQNMGAAEAGADSDKDVEKDKDEKEEKPGASAMETDTQVLILAVRSTHVIYDPSSILVYGVIRHHSLVAQLLEHPTGVQKVIGANSVVT